MVQGGMVLFACIALLGVMEANGAAVKYDLGVMQDLGDSLPEPTEEKKAQIICDKDKEYESKKPLAEVVAEKSLMPGGVAKTADEDIVESVRHMPMIKMEPRKPFEPVRMEQLSLYQTSVNSTAVSLDWDRAASGRVNYKLFQFSAGQSSKYVAVYEGTVNALDINGLQPGQTYKFKVMATQKERSVVSTPLIVTTLPVVPGPVDGLKYMSSTTSSVKVTWNPPMDDGGAPITAYQIWTKVEGDSKFKFATEVVDNFGIISGLSAGTSLTVTVVAINKVGPGVQTNAVPLVTQSRFGPPDSVDTIKLLNKTSSSVSLLWAAPSFNGGQTINSYRVFMKADQRSYALGCETSSKMCTVSSLKPAVKYIFKVIALNSVGGSTDGNTLLVKTASTTPSAPEIVPLVTVTTKSAALKWSAPSCSGGDPVTGYQILQYTFSDLEDAKPKTVWTGPHFVQNAIVGGLNKGSSYNFSVVAVNGNGAGKPSVPMTVQTKITVPGPCKMALNLVNQTNISLIWTPPEDEGGWKYLVPITGYKLTGVNTRTGLMVFNTTVLPFPTSLTVNGLHGNTPYKVSIAAINKLGSGPANSLQIRTSAVAPCSPMGLLIFDRRSDSVVMSWQNGRCDGGMPLLGYVFQSRASADGKVWESWTEYDPLMIPLGKDKFEAEYVYGNLKYAWNYKFRMAAINAHGRSAWSDAVAVGVEGVVPGPVDFVKVVDVNPTTIMIEWTEPDSTGGLPVEGYKVSWRTTTDAYFLMTNEQQFTNQVVGEDMNSYVIKNLEPGTEYEIKVQPKNAVGLGPSIIDSVFTHSRVPNPPRPAIAKDITESSIHLEWEPTRATGGSPVLGYQVMAKPELENPERALMEDPPWTMVYEGESLTTTVHNLARATNYYFLVKARNSIGLSLNSNETKYRTLNTVPGKTEKLIIDEYTSTTVTLSWLTPLDMGGVKLKWYIVSQRSCGEEAPLLYIAMTNKLTIENLKPTSPYTFSVQTVNALGTGEASFPLQITTKSAVPLAPLDARVMWVEWSSLSLRWAPPADDGGSPITSYKVFNNGNTLMASTAPSQPFTILKRLSPMTSYNLSVVAVNSIGEGPMSKRAATSTTSTIPGAANGLLSTSKTYKSISLSWTPPPNGGAAILHYIVLMKSGNGIWTQVYKGADPVCTISNLIRKNLYSFTVSAVNALGPGSYCDPLVLETDPTMPGPPINLHFQDVQDKSMTVLWDEGADDGGVEILEYRVRDGNTGREWTSSDLSLKIGGLQSSTVYKWAVSAINPFGASVYSTAVEVASGSSCQPHPVIQNGDLECTGVAQGSVCTAECHDGYTLSTTSNSTSCGANGQWVRTLGCDKVETLKVPVVLHSSYRSSDRTVFVFKSDAEASLQDYNRFCEFQGLNWFKPRDKADAQLLINTCDGYETGPIKSKWIITKNTFERVIVQNSVKDYAVFGGFKVQVDVSKCWVEDAGTGHSSQTCKGGEFCGVRKTACAVCLPTEYGRTSCWETRSYDWLVCESNI